jgi:ethanolamine utilization protein EutN
MILGRVTGSIVSTIHHPIVEGRTLLVAERLDQNGRPTGGYIITIDTIGAGQGETVLILDEGSGARQILANDAAPVRSIVVGIVDALDTSTS